MSTALWRAWALLGALCCGHPAPPKAFEPLPTAYHDGAASLAAQLVPDPARGGPPVAQGASPLPPFLGVDRSSARYAGPEACLACHDAAHSVWAPSVHAGTVRILAEVQRDHDPSCLPCHTTGMGHPGGFGSAVSTKDLASVSCEACHGPGSNHTAGPAPGYGLLPTGPAACVACHDHDHSPLFLWDSYWPRIEH